MRVAAQFCRFCVPENWTHTVTHIAEWREKRCGSGISKKFPDLLIFDKKHLQTLVLQWIEDGMGFVISRSGVRVTPLAPQNTPKTIVFGVFCYAKSYNFQRVKKSDPHCDPHWLAVSGFAGYCQLMPFGYG